MPSRGLSRALGMAALHHADEDDGMPRRLPIFCVNTDQAGPLGSRIVPILHC
jgi:hypothetical protein